MRSLLASVIVTMVAGLAVAACASGAKPSSPPAVASGSSSGGAGAPPDAAAAAVAPLDAAAVEAPPKNVVPADLPPFGKVATVDRAKSDEIVAGILRSAMQGLTAEPIDPETFAGAVEAVRADPGSPFARYALACVAQDAAAATALFEPLIAAKDCPECVDAVRNIVRGSCMFPDEVLALANRVTPSKQRVAAEAVAGAIASGDPSKATPYFKAAKTELITNCYACDMEPGDSKKKLSGAQLLKAITADVAKQIEENGFGGIDTGLEMTCAKDCCTVVSGMMQHNRDFLETICFAKGTDQVRSIRIQPGG